MSNVDILYEGPYDATGKEQMARSRSGKWFSRHYGSWSGERGAKCMTPWRPAMEPRRPWPTDKIFLGMGRELLPTGGFCIVPVYRGPTEEECESGIWGSNAVLRLVTGTVNVRLPQTPQERLAAKESREIERALKNGSQRARSHSSARL
jgi:hypothetical protein